MTMMLKSVGIENKTGFRPVLRTTLWVMLLTDGWVDGLMDEGGKSGSTSNSKNLISFPVESLIYGRNSNLVYWTA